MEKAYLPRQLTFNNQIIHERELDLNAGCIVILAEPGAGKTYIMEQLAEKLSTLRLRANIFRSKSQVSGGRALVIDGLDEVAKLQDAPLDDLFIKASDLSPQLVIFACRSSEWDAHRYLGLLKELFGQKVRTYHLAPFNEQEQRSLFSLIYEDESFDDFLIQAQSFELAPLLGNPLFLKLFGAAYVQNNRVFINKRKIFSDAVQYLAKEINPDIPTGRRPVITEIVSYSEEIYAKLLLAGAEGYSSTASVDDPQFPYLYGLTTLERNSIKSIMDTGLFRVAEGASLHEPVHRVIAEYGAANYLVRRIADKSNPLSLRRCFAIIAPNNVVRNELRGLLGWLAALGDKDVQNAAIELDAYAVLANGDPSQLTHASKIKLISSLVQLAKIDPYFRQSDHWRSFSVKGFFSSGVVNDVKPLLLNTDDVNQLRDLLLELLEGSGEGEYFGHELKALLVNPELKFNVRYLAHKNLVFIQGRHHLNSFRLLLAQSTLASLELASLIVGDLGVEHLGKEPVLDLLRALRKIYPPNRHDLMPKVGDTTFIELMVKRIKLADVEFYLNMLCAELLCTCGASKRLNCECCVGASKLIGLILDRYFELNTSELDPERIWGWVRNLNFIESVSPAQSFSVAFLHESHFLRQSIQRLAFQDIADEDSLWRLRCDFDGWVVHAGLCFQADDIRQLVVFAFEANNILLWRQFFQHHSAYAKEKGRIELRTLMRSHANTSLPFMREWVGLLKQEQKIAKKYNVYRARSTTARVRKQHKISSANRQYSIANRELIASGNHWGWLVHLSELYLFYPDKILDHVADSELAESALSNCLSFIDSDIPILNKLAELAVESKGLIVENVLYAAAVVIFKKNRSLERLSARALVALKVKADCRYHSIDDDLQAAMDSEISRCLFKEPKDVENFLRGYFEPQLMVSGSHYVSLDRLRSKAEFSQFKVKLALEWLGKFPDMPYQALEVCFQFCVEDAHIRTELNKLIEQRTAEVLVPWIAYPPTEAQVQRRKFWCYRYFCFIKHPESYAFDYLKGDPNSVFLFEMTAGRWVTYNYEHWPVLGAEKLYTVLDAFVACWPKVELPSSWGTDSPKEEKAYRFLSEVIFKIGHDDSNISIPVINKLLEDERFSGFSNDLLHLKAQAVKKRALVNFTAPNIHEIVGLLDGNKVASVEDLRALILEQFNDLQVWLKGTPTDPLDAYYVVDKHVDENIARNRIVEFLEPRCRNLGVTIDIEKHMAGSNRCDITASASCNNKPYLLVIEVKGQWHKELYTAAQHQLFERYSIHPDAAEQGIYLVLWFGSEEEVAKYKTHSIGTLDELREDIIKLMPNRLHGKVDVVVLDLSRLNSKVKKPKGRASKA